MANNNDLFASVVSDIKNYTGKDPLLPWIRGIRKMKDSLPPPFLKEKLPRFLQKCAQTFDSDPRYRNDLRYLRVWLQLMDFVDDPKALLRTMEANRIGTKHSLFYQAYALYYEKNKKFEEAEKMYHLGVQNLAEPLDGLQKSYEQFLHRMERHKNQRIKRQERSTKRPLSARNIPPKGSKTEENNENTCSVRSRFTGAGPDVSVPGMCTQEKDGRTKRIPEEGSHFVNPLMESNHNELIAKTASRNKQQITAERVSDESEMFCNDDKFVAKFVDTAIVGKSEAEDACHHGLVDPTINMKEAMNAINSMFQEPLESAPVGKRSFQRRQKDDDKLNNWFKVFVDENLGYGTELADQREAGFPQLQHSRKETHQTHQEPLSIFIDDDVNDEIRDSNDEEANFDHSDFGNPREGSVLSSSHANMFVFPSPKDLGYENSDDLGVQRSPRTGFREDTVVCRFVGSTISDEPEVENVCHHGLVEPTINLKQAMDDINNMFGKPIDFVRTKRVKKQNKAPDTEKVFGGFSILPDDDLEHQPVKPIPKSSGKSRRCDLFEPTLTTKEAMDDINKMFGMPLDF